MKRIAYLATLLLAVIVLVAGLTDAHTASATGPGSCQGDAGPDLDNTEQISCTLPGYSGYVYNSPSQQQVSAVIHGDMDRGMNAECTKAGGTGTWDAGQPVYADQNTNAEGTFSCTISPPPFIDIGLRVRENISGTPTTVHIAIENPTVSATSKLKIAKSGTIYHVALVAVGDVNASKVHVKMGDGTVMALRTCTASNSCNYVQ